MSVSRTSEERPQGYVKPVKRPRCSPALPFLFAFLQPVTFAFLSTLHEQPIKAATRKHPLSYPDAAPPPPKPTTSPLPPRQFENLFVDALVQSCSCRQHARSPPTYFLGSRPPHLNHRPRRRHQDTGRQVRYIHRNTTPVRLPPPVRTPLSREEYIGMLDWYREPFSTQATDTDSEPFRPPSDSKASWANGSMPKKQDVMSEPYEESAPLPSLPPASELSGLPESLKSSKPFDPSNSSASLDILRPAEPPPLTERRESNYDDPSATKLLEILDKDDCTHVAAFQAYSELRYPGVWYLSDDSIRLLFRRLSVVEKKNKDSMLRYLSVVDDMKSSGFDMTQAEWNSAIAFCGQCFARISADDVETALRTWKEMEEEAKVKGGHVTFNILFDMAAKSGKFVLAEMILKEMETRKLRINRYARVGLIFYHGLKADGDGIRRAYREFVEAGEIVDTVVMNCVIASFMRAGEPSAADQVYERMKRMLSKYTGQTIPLLRWKETRDLGRILNRAAREFKDQPERLQQLRNEQLLAPNLRTYAIFVEHHASRTGELRRISTLLTEMSHLGIPIHGRIFLKIFKGFAFHGGLRYTSWTTARLESVWDALLVAVEETDVKVMRWTVVWAVRAFERCAGRERMFEVWGELRRRWKPGDWGELQMVMGLLRDCLDVDDFK